MPINPLIVENPYGLPPLEGSTFTDEERRRLGMRPVVTGAGVTPQSIEDVHLEMMRSIAEQAQQPGANQAALGRALSAASTAVPISEFKPAPQPLPVSSRERLRLRLESRERQMRALEKFASDPKNPVSQEEVSRIEGRIEAEFQRTAENETMPSPVAFYENLVEQSSPEIIQAKTKENLLTIPGFKKEWSSFVTFDEDNQPVYPKWMEKPLEDSMARAMGVAKKEKDPTLEAAVKFQEEELKRAEPNPADYEGKNANPQYTKDRIAWENRMRALFLRTNPDAARLLPTFAEERGFISPVPLAPPAPSAAIEARDTVVSPVALAFNVDEVEQLRVRLAAGGDNPIVSVSADELRDQVASGEVSPGDTVIVSTPSGAVALKMQSDGKFQQVGRFSSRR